MIIMRQSGYDMLYLITCALNEKIPNPDRIKEMDREKLYQMSKFHSLNAMVAMVLETGGEKLANEWRQAKEKAVRKSILFDAEYKRIAGFMEENGIWYMPLKGRILQQYYPKKGMREMADTDILFDEKYQNDIYDFMISSGYKAEGFGKGRHDAYLKEPVYVFEMHLSLFEEGQDETFADYYSNVKERLIKQENNAYEYSFKKEDFYVYFLSHAYKHYSDSGTGIRSLVDCYVFLRTNKDSMDWEYIEKEVNKLGIMVYEEEIRTLCEKIFTEDGTNLLSEEEEELLEYYLFSGTYGTKEHIRHKQMEVLSEKYGAARAKRIYIFRRLFPKKEALERYCPRAKKYKCLLVWAWIKRCFLGVIRSRKRIRREVRHVKSF